MIVYKIGRKKHASQWPADGSLYGYGRWHRKGQLIVYTSQTVSLAKLEVLANRPPGPSPPAYMLFTIQLHSSVDIYEVKPRDLPKGWDKIPYPTENWDLTDRLLAEGHNCIKVPSAVTPTEYNILLNGRHPSFADVFKVRFENITLDPRLLK